jgi:hypothetical protein
MAAPDAIELGVLAGSVPGLLSPERPRKDHAGAHPRHADPRGRPHACVLGFDVIANPDAVRARTEVPGQFATLDGAFFLLKVRRPRARAAIPRQRGHTAGRVRSRLPTICAGVWA